MSAQDYAFCISGYPSLMWDMWDLSVFKEKELKCKQLSVTLVFLDRRNPVWAQILSGEPGWVTC